MIEVRTSQITDVEDEFNKGVFANTLIKEGTRFHRAPVLPYPNEQHEHIEKTYLADYAFEYGEHHTAFLLGYGMMFNHSYEPNAIYEINFDNHSFDFYAYRDIQPDEEIFINYNGEADIDDPLWFNKEEEQD